MGLSRKGESIAQSQPIGVSRIKKIWPQEEEFHAAGTNQSLPLGFVCSRGCSSPSTGTSPSGFPYQRWAGLLCGPGWQFDSQYPLHINGSCHSLPGQRRPKLSALRNAFFSDYLRGKSQGATPQPLALEVRQDSVISRAPLSPRLLLASELRGIESENR